MSSSTQSTLGSLPMLGENDDFTLSVPLPSSTVTSSLISQSKSHVTAPPRTISPLVKEKQFVKSHDNLNNEVGVLSDSSSSDSTSDSSDSESEKSPQQKKVNGNSEQY